MAMLAKKIQSNKTAAIEKAKETFAQYSDFIFADYRGMTVEQITNLRKKLREQKATLKVVKNNFARIAFEEMKIDNIADYLKGPTVIAMVNEDSNVVAKTLFDFTKETPALSIKGGYVEKNVLDKDKIEAYSKVPGKKELIAMLMSAMNGPVRQLAATIKAYTEKKEKEGDAPAKAAAPATEAKPAEATAEKPVDAPTAEAKSADEAKPTETAPDAPVADATAEAKAE